MSHFTVLIVTDQQPDDTALEAILQPWHEYECTGIEDEYVVDVDVTDELVADHAKYGKGEALDEFAGGWSSAEKRDDGRWYRHTNPNAKWDWWVVGGRWSGLLTLRETAGVAPILGRPGLLGSRASDGPRATDQAPREAIAEVPATFAVVKDGQWFERGKMGWWACVTDESADWDAEFAKLVDEIPPTAWLTVVDCHI